MNEYRAQKDKLEIEAMKRNPETAYLVDKETFDNRLDELGAFDAIEACGMYVDRAMYNMKRAVQNFFRELLELLFNAAALVIDTLRTFFLIVLSILGPVSFAISCWDGFQASLSQWFVRYISIYLWLPVSDLFSSVLARIQVLMLQRDIERLSDPDFIPDSSNAVYITFLIIGIIGYFTIPTVSNWIVQAGGGAGNYPQECEPRGIPGRFSGGWYGRSSGGKHCRKAYQSNNSIKHLQNGIQIIEEYRDQLPTAASVREWSICVSARYLWVFPYGRLTALRKRNGRRSMSWMKESR